MFLITTIYLFNSFKAAGKRKKNSFTTVTSDNVCITKYKQNKPCVRFESDHSRTEQLRGRQRVSEGAGLHVKWWFWALRAGGTGLTRPAGIWRQERKGGREGRGGRGSKTIVKIQKGTVIRTIEDPQQKFITITLERENLNLNQT